MNGTLSDVAFVSLLLSEVEAGRPVGMASLLSTCGSMPRHEGARLAVLADGTAVGTVGGGALEQVALARARAMAHGDDARPRLEWQTHERHGMACGGDALLATCALGKGEAPFLRALADLLARDEAGWVVEDWGSGARPSLAVVPAEGAGAPAEALADVASWDEGTLRFSEPVGPDPVCYVFGGGHVGSALVGVLASVGFRVVVYDDRPSIAVPERFPAAERVVCGDFRALGERVRVGARDYVVCLTHGHAADIDVLERVLPARPAYVGCIGSRRKADFARRTLVERGLPEGDVAAVHLPIGEKILAVTPAEIAVSIAAEMIRCRAERRPVRPHEPSPRPAAAAGSRTAACPLRGEGA